EYASAWLQNRIRAQAPKGIPEFYPVVHLRDEINSSHLWLLAPEIQKYKDPVLPNLALPVPHIDLPALKVSFCRTTDRIARSKGC
ncbi:MAG: hypothetical protein LWX55_16885, partial [Deltaproteobacteria bacterium]|nr:hypothetical protein [Deltaproteobacteria bacterium]